VSRRLGTLRALLRMAVDLGNPPAPWSAEACLARMTPGNFAKWRR
jgi:hypothetical protein